MADPNRAMFESVVRLLTPILNQVVFVGGSTTALPLTDPAAAGIRPTKDVDAIVNTTSYAEYQAIWERLKALGLAEHRAAEHVQRYGARTRSIQGAIGREQ